jgi:hypothetical protein
MAIGLSMAVPGCVESNQSEWACAAFVRDSRQIQNLRKILWLFANCQLLAAAICQLPAASC